MYLYTSLPVNDIFWKHCWFATDIISGIFLGLGITFFFGKLSAVSLSSFLNKINCLS